MPIPCCCGVINQRDGSSIEKWEVNMTVEAEGFSVQKRVLMD